MKNKKKFYESQKLICKYPEPETILDKLRNYYCRILGFFRLEKARHLEYCHVFEDYKKKSAIIVERPTGFRAYEIGTEGFTVKNEFETVYPHGIVVLAKCKYCGLKSYRWYPDLDNYIELEYPEEE